jgi:hypothetical protein
MGKRVILAMIPAAMLLIIIFILGGGQYLKQPRGDGDDVGAGIERLQTYLLQQEWERAEREAEQVEAAWRQVVPRIQFSVERQGITEFETHTARMRGGIAARDKATALAALAEARYHWERLGK